MKNDYPPSPPYEVTARYTKTVNVIIYKYKFLTYTFAILVLDRSVTHGIFVSFPGPGMRNF